MSGITQAVRYTATIATLPSKLNSVGTILRNINPFHSFNGRQRQGLNYVKLLLAEVQLKMVLFKRRSV